MRALASAIAIVVRSSVNGAAVGATARVLTALDLDAGSLTVITAQRRLGLGAPGAAAGSARDLAGALGVKVDFVVDLQASEPDSAVAAVQAAASGDSFAAEVLGALKATVPAALADLSGVKAVTSSPSLPNEVSASARSNGAPGAPAAASQSGAMSVGLISVIAAASALAASVVAIGAVRSCRAGMCVKWGA